MYAKSMIEYVHARAVAGAWSQHLYFVPVALALTVAFLPFTLQPAFVKSPQLSPTSERRAEPAVAAVVDYLFQGRLLTHFATAPKRTALPLDAQQRAVAGYITRKYGVSTEVVHELVRIAFAAGHQFGVDPLLVVAMMAVESSFNPIAESVAGAKGLMQVIPKYHLEKFADYGGENTVFDPRVNILVGARILREYLLTASGDLFTALQTYAGALADRAAVYSHRVLNEKDLLDALAGVPRTDRGTRVVMQVETQRPGTLLAPTPAVTPPSAQPPPLAPVQQPANLLEEAAHTAPTQQPQQPPTPLPPINA